MNNYIETRALPSELRVKADSRTVEGYSIVFNRFSQDLGGFREIIKPEAIEGVIERSDILALLNHNQGRGILARSTNGKGTLTLTVDSKGVRYQFEAPRFDLGNELIEGIKRGDIFGSSFSFNVDADGDYFDRDSTGGYIRVITQFNQLFDVSPVYSPAYTMTSVGMRKFEQQAAISRSVKDYQKHIELLRKCQDAEILLHKQKLQLS